MEYTVACRLNWFSLEPLSKYIWKSNSYGSVLAPGLFLSVGWLQEVPHLKVRLLLRDAGGGREWREWNRHLLCVWAWVNSIIISEAVITCSSVCWAAVAAAAAGPPCFRQQVQFYIWQLSLEGVIQSSWGGVDPVRFQRVRAKISKTANLWLSRGRRLRGLMEGWCLSFGLTCSRPLFKI